MKYFTGIKWSDNHGPRIIDGKFKSRGEFNPDSGKLIGYKYYPITITDSTITYQYLTSLHKKDSAGRRIKEIKGDTLITLTKIFDFKRIYNQKTLILYPIDKYGWLGIYKTNDSIRNFIETHNYKQIRFEIDGISTGDTVNEEAFTLNDIYNRPDIVIKTYESRAPNISVETINSIIYEINKSDISSIDIDDIIKVITLKCGNEPNYSKPIKSNDLIHESYGWYNNGIDISLSKFKYVGNDHYRMLYSSKGWDLTYTNEFLEQILTECNTGEKAASIHIK